MGQSISLEELEDCCGSSRWCSLVLAGAPYASGDALLAGVTAAFDQLGHDDWLEAFSAHSSIGAVKPGARTDAREQSGMSDSSDALRTDLAAANAEYHARFGYGFLIRASGRGGEEMLAQLRERLNNSAEDEFAIACAQEREIVGLRVHRLIDGVAGDPASALGRPGVGGVR